MRNKSVKNITYYKGNKYSTCNRQKKLLKKANGISYLLKTIGLTAALSVSTVVGVPYIYSNSINIVQAATYTGTVTGVDEGGLRVRSSTSTENTSNVITKVYTGDTFDVLDTVYNGSAKWYRIGFTYNGTYTYGYVSADYVTVKENSSSDNNNSSSNDNSNNSGSDSSDDNNSGNDNDYVYDEDFEAMLSNQGFPESYKESLRQVHAQYPGWIFTAEHIDIDWNEVVKNQNALGRSLVYGYAKESWKSKAEGAYNSETGEYTVFDSGGWVQASEALIKYALDPRNFLNSTNVFMFEDLAFNSSLQNEQGVKNVIAGTFMDGSSHELVFDGVTYTYASGLMYAGMVSGVSPYHLATRIIQEQGNNGQGLSISGTYSGYEGLFNYYNQGAYKSGTISAVENGLIYASKNDPSTYRAWNTRMKSIIGGAKILGANYINRGQNTLYYEKFDMITPYTHQYMTFILAPRQESVTASKAYSETVKQSTALRFIIPIYDDMPDTVCLIPDGNSSDNNNGNNSNTSDDNNKDDDIVVKFTGMKLDGNNVWRYYVDDEIDYTYTGMAENEYGWWYFNNGNLDVTYTGMAHNESGWYYFVNGRLDTSYTGIASDGSNSWYYVNGTIATGYTGMLLDKTTWLYVNEGCIDYNYTGMAFNEYGWWYFSNGELNTSYTGMAENEYGWWYYTNGRLDTSYTGEATNEYGSWYYINGRIAQDYIGMLLDKDQWKYVSNGFIDYNYTGMALNEYGWWYYSNGELNTSYTGMALNEYGWWYYSNGRLDTSYTGMALNEYGWWYYSNGRLDTSYTGKATNEYGSWYYVDGRIAQNYTGMLLDGEDWKYIQNGLIDYNYTGMAVNDYGWWYFSNGTLDTSYTGKATNEYGSWYYINGRIAQNYTGMVLDGEDWKYIQNGLIVKNYTGMASNEYGWGYFNNGKLDTSYTGVAYNDYGKWYFVNGQIDYNHKW